MKSIKIEGFKDALQLKHKKEKSFKSSHVVISFQEKEVREVLTVRFYATKKTDYCCLWLNTYGSSSVDCKPVSGSASSHYGEGLAFEKALKTAGILLSGEASTNGKGVHSIKASAEALVKKLGFNYVKTISAHG